MLFVMLQSEKRSDSRKAIACLQPLIVLLGSEFAHFHLGLEAGYNLSNLVEKKKKRSDNRFTGYNHRKTKQNKRCSRNLYKVCLQS